PPSTTRFRSAPAAVGGVVQRQVAAVPLAHPDATAAVAPDASRALVLRRRLDDLRIAGVAIDARDERSRERAPPDLALRRRADAVGPATARRAPHPRFTRARIDAADEAALPGEPQRAVRIEGGGVEIRVGRAFGQREHAHFAPGPADANDRVPAAVGQPRGAIGSLDHAVRRRSLAERDELGATGLRVEAAEVAAAVRGEPDAAVGRGRDVVDAGAL